MAHLAQCLNLFKLYACKNSGIGFHVFTKKVLSSIIRTFLRQKKSEAASSQMLVKSSNYISLVSEEVAKAVAQTAASGTMNLANPVNSRSLISEQFVKAIAKAEGVSLLF